MRCRSRPRSYSCRAEHLSAAADIASPVRGSRLPTLARGGSGSVGSVTVAARTGARALLGPRLVVAVLAAAVFVASWAMLDHWFFSHGRIVDTPYYQSYGLSMRNGEVPYRDFAFDYPPGALPVFLAPTYVGEPTWIVDYQRWFARLMAVCGLL